METLVKAFNPAEVNFTPGEKSDVSWITTDVVDNEGDVVVARGVDFKSVFAKNPVVMVCHDYAKSPAGTCAWIKAASTGDFNGLCAKTVYDDDPDAAKLFGLVQRKLFNGRSIGFRPPLDMAPGDWGPPTTDELKARPDWSTARRVIRRCVMLEYSICPLPMNQESLTIAVAKGLELPSYLASLAKGEKDDDGPDDDDADADMTDLGYCPRCGGKSVERVGGMHRCENGHTYPAKDALGKPPEKSIEIIPAMPPHRTLAEVEAELVRGLKAAFDPAAIVEASWQAELDRLRGVI